MKRKKDNAKKKTENDSEKKESDETKEKKKSCQRKDLPLSKKIEVIQARKEQGSSLRELGKMFGCGKSQISTILNNQASLLEKFEAGSSFNPKRACYSTPTVPINLEVLKWMEEKKKQDVKLTNADIKEFALKVANTLKIKEFAASNGWVSLIKERCSTTSPPTPFLPP